MELDISVKKIYFLNPHDHTYRCEGMSLVAVLLLSTQKHLLLIEANLAWVLQKCTVAFVFRDVLNIASQRGFYPSYFSPYLFRLFAAHYKWNGG